LNLPIVSSPFFLWEVLVKKIQYWLGHEDIKTTLDIYAHYVKHKNNIAGNDMEEAAEMINNLF
jgi:integrase